MTKEEAKIKAKKMFAGKGDRTLACVLINSIYADFEKELDGQCENIEHDFTVSTKELCQILEYFKKNMLQ